MINGASTVCSSAWSFCPWYAFYSNIKVHRPLIPGRRQATIIRRNGGQLFYLIYFIKNDRGCGRGGRLGLEDLGHHPSIRPFLPLCGTATHWHVWAGCVCVFVRGECVGQVPRTWAVRRRAARVPPHTATRGDLRRTPWRDRLRRRSRCTAASGGTPRPGCSRRTSCGAR